MSGADLSVAPLQEGTIRNASLPAVSGKPAVRNDREDRGNVGIIRSPVRASILPDRSTSAPSHAQSAREGFGEALTGGRIGQPVSRERFPFWVPTPCKWRKATNPGASSRALGRPGVVRDPGMCRRFLHGNRESRDRPFGNSRRSASGRRGAVADDARSREAGYFAIVAEKPIMGGERRSGSEAAVAGGVRWRGLAIAEANG